MGNTISREMRANVLIMMTILLRSPNTQNETFGYTCVVLGHKWTLKKDTGGQCYDTYQHFFMNKGSGVNCKKGRHHNFVRDATINKDSDICALRVVSWMDIVGTS